MKRGIRAAALWIAMSALAWCAAAQTAPKAPAAAKAPAPVATVGARSIARDDFEQRARAALEQYRMRAGGEIPAQIAPVVRRQVLEGLIRRELLSLEVVRRGALGTPAEAEAQVRKDPFFNPGGKFDATRFEEVKTQRPQLYQIALQQMREAIGARNMNERLEREFSPPEAELRARAERSLTKVKLDYFALRKGEFAGSAPEPRESDVVGYWRSHPDEFRRPDRAVLSVAFVNVPALSESLQAVPEQLAAWERRMKAIADSGLAAIRSGVAPEDVVSSLGGFRGNVVVYRDNFPGYWRGDDRQTAAVFSSRPGTILTEAVRGRPGWLIVRVDEVQPAHVAPLREVGREVRGKLRAEARAHADERELRALYQQLGSELRTTAYRVRWAAVDTSALTLPEPSAADLDRYYRAHLADYSSFDHATGTVQARPFSAVEAEVRTRYRRDRKLETMRLVTDAIERAWSAGRRDRALEARATMVREAGPLVLGAPVDTGLAARAVADSLARLGGVGVGEGPFARGRVVYHAYQAVPNTMPAFEAALPLLRPRRDEAKRAADEKGGRDLFDRDPMRFASGNEQQFTRFIVPFLPIVDVPLTRAEVLGYYQRHIDKYTLGEEVRVRHILIEVAPGVRSDSAGRELASELRRRIVAGEDFAALARRYSDDTPTRDKGGDLGSFGRGAMRETFERASFALQPGQLSDLVRSDLGWHVIQCLDRLPPFAQPIETMWANVGADAAQEKADSLAARRADSLYRAVKSRAQLERAASRLGLDRESIRRTLGDTRGLPELRPVLETLDRLKPGEMYPGRFLIRGIGYALAAVDTVLPPGKPTWESSRERAISTYQAGAADRALEAKRAELDSLFASGLTLDSLAAAWGGLQRFEQNSRGQAPTGLAPGRILDSLTVGTAEGGAPLAVGQASGWVRFTTGEARFRIAERTPPADAVLASRVESERRNGLERRLTAYYDELKTRYPVRILDATLREVDLPKPPPETP